MAQQMADARAEGVQSRAQAGGAQGAQRRGGVRTPQRPPAAVRRQSDGQQRASAPTPASVAKLFRGGLSYRDISGRLGITEALARSLKHQHDRTGMSMYQRVADDIRNGGMSLLSGYDIMVAHERAALTTANNVGGGLVGDYKMPGAGFDHDMGAIMLIDALNVVPIPRGEFLVYSGDTAPATLWTAEGAPLVDNTTPTIGRVEADAKTVSSVFEFSSSLAKAGGPEAEMEFQRWVDELLYEAWVSAALVGDGTMDRPTGILRNAGIHTIDYGAALTQAHIRAVRDRLRTQKGTGEDALWILSEAWASAAIAGGWASETSAHGGVLLQDNAGNGLPYLIVQGLTRIHRSDGSWR